MYQGKFDAKSKGQQAPDQALDNIIRERAEDNAARAARKASRDARRSSERPQQNARAGSQRPAPQRAQQQRTAPAAGQRPTPAQRSAAAPAQRPKKQTEVEVVQQQRRGPRLGGIIFYSMYFMLIFVFFIKRYICRLSLKNCYNPRRHYLAYLFAR